MATEFVTPVGRLVQGDPLKAVTTDRSGNPLLVKTGPNKGKPTQQFFISVAFPKMTENPQTKVMEPNPGYAAFYNILYAEGRRGYPQMFDAQGNCVHPRFTFKVMDGDGVDNNGVPNNTKEGFAGHWVVKFVTQYAPKLIDLQGQYIIDPSAIKRGYFVRVFGNTEANLGSDVPGVYVNHTGIQLCGWGQEISGGADIAAAFAAAGAVVLPPGASATPLAPAAMPALPGVQGGPPPQQMTPPMQPPAMHTPPPMQPPGAMPPPNHGFVQGAMQPGVQGGPPPMMPPPAAPQYIMTPKAQGWAREEWHRSGYTDEVLLAQGFMIQA